jgi:MATE family multidrug resistance protein
MPRRVPFSSSSKGYSKHISLGIMGASTIILAIVSPINILLHIGLIHHTSLGILGSPLALSITYWICFLLLGVLTYFSPKHKENGTWGGVHLGEVLSFTSCYQFLQLAIPGILMVGTEWYD